LSSGKSIVFTILWVLGTLGLSFIGNAQAQTAGVSLVGTPSYSYDPIAETVQFAGVSIQNSSTTQTTGTLRVELWLTTTPYTGGTANGSRIAADVLSPSVSATGQLAPGQSFANVAATVPATALPAVGTYYVAVVVSEFSSGCPSLDQYCIDTYQNLPTQLTLSDTGPAAAVQVFGFVFYDYTPGTGLDMGTVALENTSDTNVTAALRLDVWLTTAPYAGGAISGYHIATAPASGVIGTDGLVQTNVNIVPVSNLPPAGSYYVTQITSEQTNACGSADGYCMDSYFDLSEQLAFDSPASTTSLVAATLPDSRSIEFGNTATVFATIINAGTMPADGCGVALDATTTAAVGLTYQTTDPATNELVGTQDAPVTLAPGAAQTFVLSLTPTEAFDPATINLSFACLNAPAAPIVDGVNTIQLSASTTPVPDVISLTATVSGDGIVDIPGATGTGFFAVASANVGASGLITVSADTGSATLPVTFLICQTSPTTGACISAVGPTVTTQINANDTPTFTVFVTGSAAIPFDPANSRVFILFSDANGVVRGSSGAAVRTQ